MSNTDYSKELLAFFESEDARLFVPNEKPKGPTADDRLAESFLEIVDFVSEHDREPEMSAEDFSEALLAKRLEAMRHTPEKVAVLETYDSLGLLVGPDVPKSIEDLVESDDFDIFGGPGSEVLQMKHVPIVSRAKSDEVARRERAEDFEKFKLGFAAAQDGLKVGTKQLVKFTNVNQIIQGRYFVSGGQMLYVDGIDEKKMVHGRMKSRMRVIFENGTESNMFLRSLASQLYYDGYCVVSEDEILNEDSDEKVTGYIYIVKSLSEDQKIQTIQNLHKIGYSTTPVAKRIAGAKDDPTYLMADVELVESYKLTGEYNPQRVEHMIHRVFADVALNLTIVDKHGHEHKPLEWYSVPIHVIREAIDLIGTGDIVHYVYDSERQVMKEVG